MTEREGAAFCRDATELSRRELELMTADATIREIHHRVSNNLQTVALRLQSRRMTAFMRLARAWSSDAPRGNHCYRARGALQGLTQNVDFDELIERQFHLPLSLLPRSARLPS